MSESEISKQIAVGLSIHSVGKITTWRNNVGNGVCGKIKDLGSGQFHVSAGRRVQYGLCPGSSDMIGLTRITITPDMVGTTLAVFTAIEVKTKTGRATPEQELFINFVRQSGGYAGIARSVDDAVAICGTNLFR